MNLSKNPDWDGNDMGRKLSRLFAWNKKHGEDLLEGVILSGFSTITIEDGATAGMGKDDEKGKDFITLLKKYRERDTKRMVGLLVIAPWVSLFALSVAPMFWNAFRSWSLQQQIAFGLLVLVIYGKISLDSLLEYAKAKLS